MLINLKQSELPAPDKLENFLLSNIEQTQKKITMLEFPLVLIVKVDKHVLEFSVQRDNTGMFLQNIPLSPTG